MCHQSMARGAGWLELQKTFQELRLNEISCEGRFDDCPVLSRQRWKLGLPSLPHSCVSSSHPSALLHICGLSWAEQCAPLWWESGICPPSQLPPIPWNSPDSPQPNPTVTTLLLKALLFLSSWTLRTVVKKSPWLVQLQMLAPTRQRLKSSCVNRTQNLLLGNMNDSSLGLDYYTKYALEKGPKHFSKC